MNRRTLLARGAAGLAVTVLVPTTLLSIACGDTKQLARWTATVIAALRDALPLLTDMGQSAIVALINKALPIAERLKKAFQDNDHADAFALLNDLVNPQTGVIAEIARLVGVIPDDGRKSIVLGILAVAQLALRLIAAQIEQDVPVDARAKATKANPVAANAIGEAAKDNVLKNAFAAVKF